MSAATFICPARQRLPVQHHLNPRHASRVAAAVRPRVHQDCRVDIRPLSGHKGVNRPVTVDVEFLGAGIDPWGNQRIGFSGVVPEVNREDWGLTWNAALETGGSLLSKSIRLEIEAELIKK